MRRIMMYGILFFALVIFVSPVCAGFDDLIKDVLVETTRPIGSDEYIFEPGDVIIKKTSYSVYYSGLESNGTASTLLLTLVEGNQSILIKYPSPDVIKVKDDKLQIISFDNESIRLRVIKATIQKYGQ